MWCTSRVVWNSMCWWTFGSSLRPVVHNSASQTSSAWSHSQPTARSNLPCELWESGYFPQLLALNWLWLVMISSCTPSLKRNQHNAWRRPGSPRCGSCLLRLLLCFHWDWLKRDVAPGHMPCPHPSIKNTPKMSARLYQQTAGGVHSARAARIRPPGSAVVPDPPWLVVVYRHACRSLSEWISACVRRTCIEYTGA